MKKTICLLLALLLLCTAFFAGCSSKNGIDYLALVNKENPLPEGWEDKVEIVHMNNSLGDDVEVEKKAYDAYLKLKEALAAEGVYIDLDSARRTVAAQQDIVDRFTVKYGEDYVKRYVAVPGYSEHHTGLALDLYLNIDGEDVYYNEDMVQYPEIWAKIHEKLPEYGFILRYLDGKEAITGYSYEPWHIRYVDSVEIAKEITSKGITLEEYLNKLPTTDVAPPVEAAEWTRAGIFADENGNLLSVTYMSEADEPGWYVGAKFGEAMYGRIVAQEGNTLHGNIVPEGQAGEFIVTVSEEGDDGLLLVVDGGETYHFTKYEMPTATIFVTINTEGSGMIAYTEGEEAPEIDPEYPYQSAQINLAEPAVYTLVAEPEAGSVFVKWTKDGEDYSTEPQITLELSESADFIAVFEEDPDWQNPVMNFIGAYQCDRAHALVECFGKEEAWITIEWANSAAETVRWIIVGRLDLETLTIQYSGSSKSILTYDENGEITNEETVYEDGTGTVTFHNDGTFTWHEDASETGEDLVFEWAPVSPEE